MDFPLFILQFAISNNVELTGNFLEGIIQQHTCTAGGCHWRLAS